MDSANHLKYLLQTQLATDTSAVRYLPYCLSTLTIECLHPSPHLGKWTTRILALLHSKDAAARWTGLCLAYKSSILSQKLMVDSAQSWITVVLPMLSRSEPIPTLKAAIRLLRVIFTTATELSEFQRRISVPHVVKFSHAVLAVSENQPDTEIKVLCIETMECIVSAYPTIHRASFVALSSFALRYLNGSSSGSTDGRLLEAASRLYSVIPLTGGKVGAVNLWRKSLEETLAFGWEAFYSLRTTFPLPGPNIIRPVIVDEPQRAIPLNQDRLRCSIVALSNLFESPIQRPVQVPLGNLIKFVASLMSCSTDGANDGFIDPLVRSMEISIVPEVRAMGCELLEYLAQQFSWRLDPHVGRLLSILVALLEANPDISRRLCILKALNSVLKNCHIPDSNVLPTRIAKSALYSLVKIFSSSSNRVKNGTEASLSKSKHDKKRSRNFEADKVFNTAVEAVYSSNMESDALLVSLDVLQSLYTHPNLSLSMQSIISRVIISSLISLSKKPSSLLSKDSNFIRILNAKVQEFSFLIGCGTTNVISKTLPFLIDAVFANDQPEMQRNIGIILHPRVPPLVRSMPHIESLSFFKAEESQEEVEALSSLGIEDLHLHSTNQMAQDVVMSDLSTSGKTTIITPPSLKIPLKQSVEPEHTPIVQNDIPRHQTENPRSHLYIRDSQTFFESSNLQNPLPPMEEQLPFLPAAVFTTFDGVTNAPVSTSSSGLNAFPTRVEEEREDEEEMPSIDMGSDTEDEEQ